MNNLQKTTTSLSSTYKAQMGTMVEKIKDDKAGQAIGYRIALAIESGVPPIKLEALILRRAGTPLRDIDIMNQSYHSRVRHMVEVLAAAMGFGSTGSEGVITMVVAEILPERTPHVTVEELAKVPPGFLSLREEERPKHFSKFGADYVVACVETYANKAWKKRAQKCNEVLAEVAPLTFSPAPAMTDPRHVPVEKRDGLFPSDIAEIVAGYYDKWALSNETQLVVPLDRIKKAATESGRVAEVFDVCRYVTSYLNTLSGKELVTVAIRARQQSIKEIRQRDGNKIKEDELQVIDFQTDPRYAVFYEIRRQAQLTVNMFDKWKRAGYDAPFTVAEE